MDTNNENQSIETALASPPTNSASKLSKTHTRRVGTLTMGFALIITGIALSLSLVMPLTDILIVAKLSPLLLVALGIEVIIFSVKKLDGKIKYDFLSIFMCGIIICVSIGASVLPTLYKYYGPQRSLAENNVAHEIRDNLIDNKEELLGLYEMNVNVTFNELREFNGTESLKDIKPTDRVYVYATFNGDYKSKEEFAKDVLPVYEKLKALSSATLQFTAESRRVENKESISYSFSTQGQIVKKLTEQDIADVTVKQFYSEYFNEFVTRERYNEGIEYREREKQNEQNNVPTSSDSYMQSDDYNAISEATSSVALE